MSEQLKVIGKPLTRKDGPEKVTGTARYTADVPMPSLAYAALVSATIASGRVLSIETDVAFSVRGVLQVLTHKNIGPLYIAETYDGPINPMGPGGQQKHMPMRDDRIVYDGQYIAIVIAESFEAAQEGALRVRAKYEKTPARVFGEGDGETHAIEQLYYGLSEAHHSRGDPERVLQASDVQIDVELHTPSMHHNPIELHCTTAKWDGDRLTIWEPSAWPHGHQYGVSEMLGIPRENVRVISHFCGGAFGGKGLAAPHTALCAIAARKLGRPVRLQLTRPQIFYCVGQRAATKSRIQLGATSQGKIESIVIDSVGDTPPFQDWACEPPVLSARHMYANDHMRTDMRVKRTNTGPTIPMRGPGETSGMFILEHALNELAEKTGVDPLELRRINHAEKNFENGLPWSSKTLLGCYDRGAELFGWKQRTAAPRSMTRDGKLIGWGMASATYPTLRTSGEAKIRIDRNGHVTVGIASHEIGTGTYTIMAQIAAETLGVPVANVEVLLGDTNLPPNIGGAGAMTAGTVGSAVQAAANALIERLATIATENESTPLGGMKKVDVVGQQGQLVAAGKRMSYIDVLESGGRSYVEARGNAAPGEEVRKYAMFAFGANFVEVEVDPITTWARVSKVVGVYASGRILNPKTSHSQIIGGMVFAIGSAMGEHSLRDPRDGRWATDDFGSYHVPVQADIPPLVVEFLPEVDNYTNPLGTKGLGELGGVGMNAAITHALHHASGAPFIRHLPYLPEKLLRSAT